MWPRAESVHETLRCPSNAKRGSRTRCLVSGGTLTAELEAIRARAADLAAGLSKTARKSATIAQERAVLRMLGIDGLDRSGRPLAAALAESYCGSHPVLSLIHISEPTRLGM